MKKQGRDKSPQKPRVVVPAPREPFFDDERWLEQLEKENDAEFEADLDLLLKNSSADRGIFSSLEKTRKLIKSSDDVLLPENGHYYENLHDRIMAAIDEEAKDVTRVPSGKTLRSVKFAWVPMLGALTMSTMLAVVAWFVVNSPAPQSAVATLEVKAQQIEVADDGALDEMKLAELSSRSYSESMVGFETESDLLAGAAAERLIALGSVEAEELLNELRQ